MVGVILKNSLKEKALRALKEECAKEKEGNDGFLYTQEEISRRETEDEIHIKLTLRCYRKLDKPEYETSKTVNLRKGV